jgi:hypothetical protein
MPIPKTRDVGKTIKFLKKDKPGMPRKQRVAIALETARRSGAKIARKTLKKRARVG